MLNRRAFCNILYFTRLEKNINSLRNVTEVKAFLSRGLSSGGTDERDGAVIAEKEVEQSQVVEKVQSRVKANEPYCPWTATKDLKKKKNYFKRMGFLMEVLEKERETQLKEERKFPKFNPGDILKIGLCVPENHHKTEEFTGVCIAKKNKGIRSSFTLRKTWPPDFGIEKIFPLYCPTIKSIEVKGSIPVRRAKLYYMRENFRITNV